MLTIAEEFLLLSHDEQSGRMLYASQPITQIALVGAVLMDLAMHDRIDNDLEKLMLVDATPLGEPALDHVLGRIAEEKDQERSVRDWIDRLAPEAETIRELSLKRLIDRGILREEEGRFLWVFATRRYPLIDNKEQTEVKLRIAQILMTDDIPDARDVAILNLADACGLLHEVFSSHELSRLEERIEQLTRLDLIGQAVNATIEELRAALVTVMPR
ncbi:GOLPH3/VPS74 family protein [Aquibaculum arenosum]|uniref:GPP34 family phosphoprotein n=1 Tax=Aquibaculum arenosum TaxID=3032591 RepID=A0ABT5YRQ1_9PROT|nr:GPP34 family phosphoprotein [Fodinicurvata sp. CAU 1616]MDF2097420.1 GPP34 family phosphoprotein [Fodinicurvata sp. CAU 1616]